MNSHESEQGIPPAPDLRKIADDLRVVVMGTLVDSADRDRAWKEVEFVSLYERGHCDARHAIAERISAYFAEREKAVAPGDAARKAAEPSGCKCKICEGHRRVLAIISRRDAGELVGLVRELEDVLSNVIDDLEYKRNVLNGSWPSSVEQLERALASAKAKRHADPDSYDPVPSPVQPVPPALIDDAQAAEIEKISESHLRASACVVKLLSDRRERIRRESVLIAERDAAIAKVSCGKPMTLAEAMNKVLGMLSEEIECRERFALTLANVTAARQRAEFSRDAAQAECGRLNRLRDVALRNRGAVRRMRSSSDAKSIMQMDSLEGAVDYMEDACREGWATETAMFAELDRLAGQAPELCWRRGVTEEMLTAFSTTLPPIGYFEFQVVALSDGWSVGGNCAEVRMGAPETFSTLAAALAWCQERDEQIAQDVEAAARAECERLKTAAKA